MSYWLGRRAPALINLIGLTSSRSSGQTGFSAVVPKAKLRRVIGVVAWASGLLAVSLATIPLDAPAAAASTIRPTMVAAGNYHSLAVTPDGVAWAWGENVSGQLGDGTTTPHSTPAPVSNLTGVTAVAGGNEYSLALRSDGTVWAWGSNSWGQLGNNSTASSSVPVQVVNLVGVIGIAAGGDHALAVKSDGTVWAWGLNNFDVLGTGSNSTAGDVLVPTQVVGMSGVKAVAAGYEHSVALKSDGTVVAWGDNSYGQVGDGDTQDFTIDLPSQVSGLAGVTAIAAGTDNSYALRSDGTVWAWGWGTYGQLGNNSTQSSAVPVQVSYLTGVTAIAAGQSDASNPSHAVALKSDGTVWSWGNGAHGELGNGAATNSAVPVQASNLNGATAIAAGWFHSLAVKSSGSTATVWGSGDNTFGQVVGGDGTYAQAGRNTTGPASYSTPVEVAPIPGPPTGVVAIARNASATVMWTPPAFSSWAPTITVYTVYTYATGVTASPIQTTTVAGSATSAVIAGLSNRVPYSFTVAATTAGGAGPASVMSNSVTPAINPATTAPVAAGLNHSLALDSTGMVWGWGDNSSGQLGDRTTTSRQAPVPVSGPVGVTDVAAGAQHSLAVQSDGKLWAWGDNSYGQVGANTQGAPDPTPTLVSGVPNIAAAAGGGGHTLAVGTDGSVWAWGENDKGQLGSTSVGGPTPTAVTGLSNVVAVAAGGNHSLALKSDGTVWAWGDDTFGQLGDGTTTSRSTPVQVSGLPNVTAIAAGSRDSLALKSDGTVWAWGDNEGGQLGNSTTNGSTTPQQVVTIANVVSIAAGSYHSLAVEGNGSVWSWGDNAIGQLGTGDTTYHWAPVQVSGVSGTAVAAGLYHSLAAQANGAVAAWGDNEYGELGTGTSTDSFAPSPLQGFTVLNVAPTAPTSPTAPPLPAPDCVPLPTGGCVTATHGVSAPSTQSSTPAGGATAATCVPGCNGANFLNHGGQVETDPQIYLIFWGPNWVTDHTGVAGAIASEFQDLSGSAYNKILTNYGGSNGVINDDVHLAGNYTDQTVPPNPATDAQLAAEITRVRTANHWGNGINDQFMIVPQAGTVLPTATALSACGYHNYNTDASTPANSYVMSVVGYLSDPQFAYPAGNCLNSGQGDALSAMTVVASHEYAEAATDPVPFNTWDDHEGVAPNAHDFEIGDMCQGDIQPAPDGTWVQYLWSFTKGECVGPVDAGQRAARVAGPDRIATAVAASRLEFRANSVSSAVLVRSTDPGWTDAIPATVLAAAVNGPLLYQDASCANPVVDQELIRALGGHGTLYVVGGGGIQPCFDTSHAGYTITHMQGATRCDTATSVATTIVGLGRQVNNAELVSGNDFPDGLSMSAVGAATVTPILVTPPNTNGQPATSMCTSAIQFLHSLVTTSNLSPTVKAAGGTNAISTAVENQVRVAIACPTSNTCFHRYPGADRFDTSAQIAQDIAPSSALFVIGNGYRWPDAIAGGLLGGLQRVATLVVDPTQAGVSSPNPRNYILNARQPGAFGDVMGGTAALSTSIFNDLANIV